MITARSRSGYSAPTRITVAAPMEWPRRIGFLKFIARTKPTTSLMRVSPSSASVKGSERPCPRVSGM